jgi:hypothetical protein
MNRVEVTRITVVDAGRNELSANDIANQGLRVASAESVTADDSSTDAVAAVCRWPSDETI